MLCALLKDVLLSLALLIFYRIEGFGRIVAAQERNAFVEVGDDVRLNCSTTNSTLLVKWNRKFFRPTSHRIEEVLYSSTNTRTNNEKMSVTTVQSVNKQHHDLIITRTNSSDAGSYNCVQYFKSLASHRLVLVDTSANCKTNLNTNKPAMEGDPIRMTCNFTYFGNLTNVDIEVGWRDSSGKVLINESCEENSTGQLNVSVFCVSNILVNLSVMHGIRCYTRLGNLKIIDGSVCDIGNITVLKKPRNIKFHPVKQEYEIGDQITCRADGNPPPQYEWFDQWNRSIASGSMVTVPGRIWLICVAWNDLGTTSANITIEVTHETSVIICIASAIAAVGLVVSAVIIVKKRMSSSALLDKPDVVSSSTSNSDSTNPNTLNNSTSYDLRTGSNTIGSTSTSDYLENEARAPRPSHEATPFPTYAEVNKSRVPDRRSFIRPMPSVGNVLNRPALIDNVEYAVVNKPKKPSNDMEMGSVGNPARRHDDCNEMQASDRGNPKDKKSKKKQPDAARNNPLEMQGDDGTIYSILNVRNPNATTVPMSKPKQKPEGRSRIVIADPNSEYASVDHRMNSIPPPPPSSRY